MDRNRITTRKRLAKIAAIDWKERFYKGHSWMDIYFGDTKAIYEKLVALGDDPKPDDVDKIIGSHSWTLVGRCNDCGREAKMLYEIGEEPDYESRTAKVCLDCLRKGVERMMEAMKHEI